MREYLLDEVLKKSEKISYLINIDSDWQQNVLPLNIDGTGVSNVPLINSLCYKPYRESGFSRCTSTAIELDLAVRKALASSEGEHKVLYV